MSVFGPPTKTVNDVFRQVKRKFGDESGVQLEDNDLIMWINDAARAIITENRILKVTATTPLIAGQTDYTFASLTRPIYAIDSLLVGGARIKNMPMPQAEEFLTQNDPRGVEVGFPQFWYEYGGTVVFWPKPLEDDTITLRYTAKPEAVTTSADLLPLPDDYFEDVVNYVLKQAYEMDENEGMARMKSDEFATSLLKREEAERTSQFMTYETITVYGLDD
jgi:hypothetical protein